VASLRLRRGRVRFTDGTLVPPKGSASEYLSWGISFFGAVAAILILAFGFPAALRERFPFLPDGKTYRAILGSLWVPGRPIMEQGLFNTFLVTVLSIFFALVLGLVVALGRISRNAFFNQVASVYTEIIRGIPLLVQLFYIYYALAVIVRVNDITAAVTGMAVCYAAYLGEIFRAGFQAIPKGQMEAAIALGLSRPQALVRIILPQTVKIVLPPIGNEFIALLKDSSLVSILAVRDIFRAGREYASVRYNYFETFTVIALVYLVLTLFFSLLVRIMENKLHARPKEAKANG
jgi:polar amino acid transport system permease protein